MNDEEALEVRFSQEEGRWRLVLHAHGRPPAARERRTIPEPDDLFDWIVSRDEDPELRARPRRLRVRPAVLDSEDGALPPVLCWPHLLDDGQSAFLLGWSLLVMTASKRTEAWEASGDIAVYRAPSLASELRALHLDGVDDLGDLDALDEGAIVVVPGHPTPAEVDAVRAAARAHRCPLVIWCGTALPPPERTLLEIVPTGEALAPGDGVTAWLARLLTALLAGGDPERALAASLRPLRGAPGPLDAWLLRGCLRPWRVRAVDQHWRIRFRHWRYEIDRTEQSGLRRAAIDGLLASPTRRAQVFVLAGPVASGVGYFRARRLELPAAVRADRAEPAWSAAPERSLDELFRWYGVKNAKALASKLAAARTGTHATVVHVSHEEATDEALPLDALGAYLDALGGLAAALPESVRLIVCVYVVTDAPERLRAVKAQKVPASLGVTLLPPLKPTLPEHEIESFLDNLDLAYDAALVTELAAMTYEAIVDALTHRYPTKLSKT